MTAQPDFQQLNEALSEEEFEELDRFLCSDATSDETMMIDALDGYLTAIALGPVTLPTSRWLPGVWGPMEDDAPEFATETQARRIISLILRHMNGIVWSLQADPDKYEPILNTVTYSDKSKDYLDGEMWSYGFMEGVALARDDWQPLFGNDEAMQVLLPIYLLGADNPTPKHKSLTRTPAQREKLAQQIASSVAALYRFWLPSRQVDHAAEPRQRVAHKIGRNVPCPCGSGKKFKKCCGAASVLH